MEQLWNGLTNKIIETTKSIKLSNQMIFLITKTACSSYPRQGQTFRSSLLFQKLLNFKI